MKDILIIGAGPAGLACAMEAKKASLDYVVIEKGCVVNSIYNYPERMKFFSTAELLEIGNIPFNCVQPKPNREEAIEYYRRISKHYELKIYQYQRVTTIEPNEGFFIVKTVDRLQQVQHYQTKNIVFATGFYDNPNLLDIGGEDLPKVFHYYRAAHPFFDRDVAVVGAGNSATQVALDLYRHDARVTLIHRGDDFEAGVKYWILPDIQNRIRDGEIRVLMNAVVVRIEPDKIVVRQGDHTIALANDFVFAMIGYHPDTTLLESIGVIVDSETGVPQMSEHTHQTNVAGVYVGGAMAAGKDTNKIFIENGRYHGEKIVDSILNQRS